MDYKSALPKNNDNISHDSPVKEALVMFSGVIAFFLIAYFILGLLVDWAVIRISPEMEAVIFSGFQVSPDLDRLSELNLPQIRRILSHHQGTPTDAYWLYVSAGVTPGWLKRQVDGRFYFDHGPKANALALAGGIIVVFSGIFDMVRSEYGIAFVLAHELGHFKHGDHLRSMGPQHCTYSNFCPFNRSRFKYYPADGTRCTSDPGPVFQTAGSHGRCPGPGITGLLLWPCRRCH
ncbi:MAG: hypothetical protein CSA25_02225 [Desulfobacter postgatei]|uniref:Peptidase M48 domain-containing protein n=1 Tax=Desulfobacter postgatei TaxID=2293 RepID=A0A2G6MTT7_9BACT|nr:MAG: hypothetical protein CSA25_02225 [Desulfobacter postgatei]